MSSDLQLTNLGGTAEFAVDVSWQEDPQPGRAETDLVTRYEYLNQILELPPEQPVWPENRADPLPPQVALDVLFDADRYASAGSAATMAGMEEFFNELLKISNDGDATNTMVQSIDQIILTFRIVGVIDGVRPAIKQVPEFPEPGELPVIPAQPPAVQMAAISDAQLQGALQRWRELPEVYDVVSDSIHAGIAARISDLSEALQFNQSSLQHLIRFEYIQKGNEIMYNAMAGLHDSLSVVEEGLGILNQIGDILNQKDPERASVDLLALLGLNRNSPGYLVDLDSGKGDTRDPDSYAAQLDAWEAKQFNRELGRDVRDLGDDSTGFIQRINTRFGFEGKNLHGSEIAGKTDGFTNTFTGQLRNLPPVRGSLEISVDSDYFSEVFTDADGDGFLESNFGGEGRINYRTGEWEVSFKNTPFVKDKNIVTGYKYPRPVQEQGLVPDPAFGDGTNQTFTGTLEVTPPLLRTNEVDANGNPVASYGTFRLTDGRQILKDTGVVNDDGETGDIVDLLGNVVGTINYITGEWSATFPDAPVEDAQVRFQYQHHFFPNQGFLIGVGDHIRTEFPPPLPTNQELYFSTILTNAPITPGSLSFTTVAEGDIPVTLTDDGNGNITGAGGTGTINYTTGEIFVEMDLPVSPEVSIVLNYVDSVGAQDKEYPRPVPADNADFFSQKIHPFPIREGSVAVNAIDTDGNPMVLKDDGAGNLIRAGVDPAPAPEGTINYMTGEIQINFTTPPGYGTEVTVDFLEVPDLPTVSLDTLEAFSGLLAETADGISSKIEGYLPLPAGRGLEVGTLSLEVGGILLEEIGDGFFSASRSVIPELVRSEEVLLTGGSPVAFDGTTQIYSGSLSNAPIDATPNFQLILKDLESVTDATDPLNPVIGPIDDIIVGIAPPALTPVFKTTLPGAPLDLPDAAAVPPVPPVVITTNIDDGTGTGGVIAVTLTSDATGAFTGAGGTGTIDYATGEILVTFDAVVPADGNVNVTYSAAASAESVDLPPPRDSLSAVRQLAVAIGGDLEDIDEGGALYGLTGEINLLTGEYTIDFGDQSIDRSLAENADKLYIPTAGTMGADYDTLGGNMISGHVNYATGKYDIDFGIYTPAAGTEVKADYEVGVAYTSQVLATTDGAQTSFSSNDPGGAVAEVPIRTGTFQIQIGDYTIYDDGAGHLISVQDHRIKNERTGSVSDANENLYVGRTQYYPIDLRDPEPDQYWEFEIGGLPGDDLGLYRQNGDPVDQPPTWLYPQDDRNGMRAGRLNPRTGEWWALRNQPIGARFDKTDYAVTDPLPALGTINYETGEWELNFDLGVVEVPGVPLDPTDPNYVDPSDPAYVPPASTFEPIPPPAGLDLTVTYRSDTARVQNVLGVTETDSFSGSLKTQYRGAVNGFPIDPGTFDIQIGGITLFDRKNGQISGRSSQTFTDEVMFRGDGRVAVQSGKLAGAPLQPGSLVIKGLEGADLIADADGNIGYPNDDPPPALFPMPPPEEWPRDPDPEVEAQLQKDFANETLDDTTATDIDNLVWGKIDWQTGEWILEMGPPSEDGRLASFSWETRDTSLYQGTINYLTGEWTLTIPPVNDIPEGTPLTVDYRLHDGVPDDSDMLLAIVGARVSQYMEEVRNIIGEDSDLYESLADIHDDLLGKTWFPGPQDDEHFSLEGLIRDYRTNVENNETNSYQRNLDRAIVAAQSINDTQKNELRRRMFEYEEFYKSASSVMSKITQILEKIAQNIGR